MDRQRRNPGEELAEAITSLRLATLEREGAVPGSEAFDDALANEELLNGLVLELVRERNQTPFAIRSTRPGRIGASARADGAA